MVWCAKIELKTKKVWKTSELTKELSKRRAHNSSPHKWYCHFWDWHNWYSTLLIKLKLMLVNFGTLNYWYWAQFTLTLLKFDISDLQNYWHLQLLIFGIIGISCFWFLELFIVSMSDIKHDWDRTWLTLAYLTLWISGMYWTLSKIGSGCNHLLLIYNPLMLSSDAFVIKSQVLCLQRAYFKNKIQGSHKSLYAFTAM